MIGGSYRLPCYSLVPWRSRGPLDTLETEGELSSEYVFMPKHHLTDLQIFVLGSIYSVCILLLCMRIVNSQENL